jgi:hypothetical protein
MRRLIFLWGTAFLISHAVKAQKIRFLDTTNVWSVVSECSCVPGGIFNLRFTYGIDTVISGHSYRFLRTGPGDSGGMYDGGFIALARGFVREDTAQQKVFIKGIHLPMNVYNDTLERVLYDYHWKVGDTLRVDAGNFHSVHYVDSVGATLINGIVCKVWHMKAAISGSLPNDVSPAYWVIEGLGCLDDPLYPAYPHFFEEWQAVYCFENSSGHSAVSPDVNGFNNTSSCILGVSNLHEALELQSKVVPNPANGHSIIQLKTPESGTLSIYNSVGMLVASIQLINADHIPVPKEVQAPGLYFYRLQMKSKAFGGRFVKIE